ncbi:Dam family site-specific DNA-(adenine-N6)-methyltransferase [Franzmannia qiaohouensis]|uniref:site-specific DNA-methyltransferase (adenine-specific) n=1 Tax=Franzmannia qiaohouensis TaxID=1329370 RepID=A0ABU1HL77_9GAMM|nr:Dam family site-specific DNA-(adenine-N6)-methyltransferase [Halomonas qiaohouensis]MDR5907564.1 Dam family site-specific DNA-(adenine-N6)-methyltransferase [Halomonas qiaohouensis]
MSSNLNLNNNVKPVLRWAGSKKRLLNRLMAKVPSNFERYVEPFCGSIVLHIALCPPKAYVGDINIELINFYNNLKLYPEEVAEQLHCMPRTKEYYYEIRKKSPSGMSDFERSVRFFYLNRHCFNGVYRTNKKGDFNVPFGSKLSSLPTVEDVTLFSERIKDTCFVASDFQKVVEKTVSGDFLYLDPPYAGGGKDRGEYGVGSFKENDIDRLQDVLKEASQRDVKILLSYADTPKIRECFSSWHIESFEVGRSVSGFARGRKNVKELLISNY